MNKKSLVGLSSVVAVVLVLSAGSSRVIAQDPAPTPSSQPSAVIANALSPQGSQQPAAATGTQLGTALSYQGHLQKSGSAYNGTCNFQFSLWDAATGGAQKGSTIPKTSVAVANGLFSVELDFGGEFVGDARWLQTAVQCAGDASYTTLTPRQVQNAVPYAQSLRPGSYIFGTDPGAIFTVQNNTGGAGLAGYSRGNAGNSYGVFGYSDKNAGVFGTSPSGIGVLGAGGANIGVKGESYDHDGVQGISHAGSHSGVYGFNDTTEPYAAGVAGAAPNGNGVYGGSENFAGGYFYSSKGNGIFAASGTGYAAYFDGRLRSNVIEIAGGSDLAERFEQADGAKAEPGTLMVADENNAGKLKISNSPYDSKVIGIVSGAGGINTGLTLHQEGALTGDLVVAVAGRVYARCEAISMSIKPGDLLTTSSIPGYCMKASDRDRRDGAVIGKAMTGLKEGKGLVLVIVNLQ